MSSGDALGLVDDGAVPVLHPHSSLGITGVQAVRCWCEGAADGDDEVAGTVLRPQVGGCGDSVVNNGGASLSPARLPEGQARGLVIGINC